MRRITVSAIRPPNSPARMDSIGNPGTGDGVENFLAFGPFAGAMMNEAKCAALVVA